jgi:hypothetical protein
LKTTELIIIPHFIYLNFNIPVLKEKMMSLTLMLSLLIVVCESAVPTPVPIPSPTSVPIPSPTLVPFPSPTLAPTPYPTTTALSFDDVSVNILGHSGKMTLSTSSGKEVVVLMDSIYEVDSSGSSIGNSGPNAGKHR